MSKRRKYTDDTLTLEWFNKEKSILLRDEKDIKLKSDVPAPRLNWINKDESLFYGIVEEEGKGLKPYWVDRNDVRVKEARPLIHKKTYKYENGRVIESDEDDTTVENILIKGDNLLALNTLKKIFDNKPEEEKVKCIYIDPPYNTGSAFENYDDNLKHSEWLTMMRDRLIILHKLLRDDGVLWASIDDDESHYLKIVCDEIFGRKNFVANVIWQKKFSPQNDANWFSDMHDHILVYAKNKDIWRPNLLPRTKEMDDRYKNYDNDTRGKWTSSDLTAKRLTPKDIYEIETPSGAKYFPPRGRSWGVSKEKFLELVKENRIWFGESGSNMPRLKRFLSDVKDGMTPLSIWLYHDVGHNQDAKKEIKSILINEKKPFDTPKPEKLLQKIVFISTNNGDMILDCFAGSGTTMAVAHKMNREWIGVEIGNHADTYCIKRLQKVISGEDQNGISKDVNWQGGGAFKYYHLGSSIISMDNEGNGDFNWNITKKELQEGMLDNGTISNYKIGRVAYAKSHELLLSKCIRKQVYLLKINPAFTSVIARLKYAKRFGVSVHLASAYVIARRAIIHKEKVPINLACILHSALKLRSNEEADNWLNIYRYKHHWSAWNFLNQNFKTC